jgi:cobalt-zinc-cadmium efflux system protein
LIYEAIERLFSQHAVNGWIVVTGAGLALVVNVATASLLFASSKGNMNVRAAYLHNLGDSLSSAGVIVAGLVILRFGSMWIDSVVTLIVSAYILVQSFPDIRRSIHILMQGAPSDVNPEELLVAMQAVGGVEEIHHLHLWELDEHQSALEAHVVVDASRLEHWATIKRELKQLLDQRFHVHHSTLELESRDESACQPCPPNEARHC